MSFRSAALLVLGLLVSRVREARGQGDEATAITALPPVLSRSLESVRDTIERQLVDGFDAAGVRTTAPADVRAVSDATTGECTAGACLADLGLKLRATYVGLTSVETARRSFTVHLRVVNAQTGRELASETTKCDATAPCPPVPKTVYELARVVGRTALPLMRAEIESARPKPSPVAAAPQRPAPSAPPAVATGRTPQLEPAARPRWVPWTALLGGVAVAGTGGFLLWKVNGADTDCVEETSGRTCYRVRSAGVEGWTMLGVGSAAAITGAVLLLTDDSGSRASIGLTPSSIVMRGRF